MTAEADYEDNMRRVSDRTLEQAHNVGRASHEIRQADDERTKREIASDASNGGMSGNTPWQRRG